MIALQNSKSPGKSREGQMVSLKCCLAKLHKIGNVGLVGKSTFVVKPEWVHKVVQRHNGLEIVPVPMQAKTSPPDKLMPCA